MHVIVRFRRRLLLVWSVSLLTGIGPAAEGQESRYYEEGGITYKEVRTKVQQPVRELEYKDEQQTYYRERYVTDMQPTAQTLYVPAVQYVWEARWHDWWRIFEGPHVAYHLVPRSTWQPQVVNYQVPITRREVTPETRTVRVAVPKLSMKEVESVTRVAVGPAASQSNMAQAPVVLLRRWPGICPRRPRWSRLTFHPRPPTPIPLMATRMAILTAEWPACRVTRPATDRVWLIHHRRVLGKPATIPRQLAERRWFPCRRARSRGEDVPGLCLGTHCLGGSASPLIDTRSGVHVRPRPRSRSLPGNGLS